MLEAEKLQAEQDMAALQSEIDALSEDYRQLLTQHNNLENDFVILLAQANALIEAQERLTFVATAAKAYSPATNSWARSGARALARASKLRLSDNKGS